MADETYISLWCRIVGHRWSRLVARTSGTQVCTRKRCAAHRVIKPSEIPSSPGSRMGGEGDV